MGTAERDLTDKVDVQEPSNSAEKEEKVALNEDTPPRQKGEKRATQQHSRRRRKKIFWVGSGV